MNEHESKRKVFSLRWRIIVILVGAVLLVSFWLGFPFDLRAGKTVSQNTFSSQSSVSSFVSARFPSRHVAIFELSGHPLLQRTASQILPVLRATDGVESVVYYPCGSAIPEGELCPDIVVSLDLKRINKGGFGVVRNLAAEVYVSMGKRPASCASTSFSSTSLPVIDFQWDGKLRHKSKYTGFISLKSRYNPHADDMAKGIAKALVAQISEWSEKYGTVPELPASFYPEYHEVENLPFLNSYGAKRMMACHGLMTHNESFWYFESDRALVEVLNDIQEQGAAQGWKTESISTDPNMLPRLKMKKGGNVLLVYPGRDRISLQTFQLSMGGSPPDSRSTQIRKLWVEYEEPMTRDALGRAVDGLFADKAAIDALLLFLHACTKSQKDRAFELFDAEPPESAVDCLALMKFHHDKKNDEEARKWLLRARVAERSRGKSNDLTQKIRKAAKDLGDETLGQGAISLKAFLDMGWTELKPGEKVPTFELQLNEPARFVVRTAKDDLKSVCVRCVKKRMPDGSDSYDLAFVEAEPTYRSWGSHDFGHQTMADHFVHIDNVGRLALELKKVSGKDIFLLQCQYRPSKPKTQ